MNAETQGKVAGPAQPVRVLVAAAPAVDPGLGIAVAQAVAGDDVNEVETKMPAKVAKENDVFAEDPFADDTESGGDILDELSEEADSAISEVPSGEEAASSGEEDESPQEVGMFEIYWKKCLRCKSLIPELTDEDGGRLFKKCHFLAGNEDCPAKDAVIIVGVPTKKIVSAILDAEQSGETEKLATIYAKLATKDPNVQAMVHQALSTARSELVSEGFPGGVELDD